MNLEDIKKLFELIEQDVDDMSKQIQSLKRDEQFLEAATGAWTSSIGMNRSMQPNDKADPS
jgi:hypothetical protein